MHTDKPTLTRATSFATKATAQTLFYCLASFAGTLARCATRTAACPPPPGKGTGRHRRQQQVQHRTISPCITPTPHKSRQTIGQASRASQASAELALRRITSTHVQGTVDGGGGTRQDAKQLSTDVAITRSLSLVLSLSQSLDGQRSSPRRHIECLKAVHTALRVLRKSQETRRTQSTCSPSSAPLRLCAAVQGSVQTVFDGVLHHKRDGPCYSKNKKKRGRGGLEGGRLSVSAEQHMEVLAALCRQLTERAVFSAGPASLLVSFLVIAPVLDKGTSFRAGPRRCRGGRG